MDLKAEKQILNKIRKSARGSAFFIDNFLSIGSAKSVNKALERLTDMGELVRVSRGTYVRPKKDKYIGYVLPGVDEIAQAIAKRDKARIVPTGSYALYKLGLTTQVPLNVVYYTDGSARKIKLGKQTITFKKTSPKILATIGPISKLAIQALRTIGKGKATDAELSRIREALAQENPYHLKHDMNLAPEWIRKTLSNIAS